MIYFTSDLHLGHPGILKHRLQFAGIEENDNTIINNINARVNKNDIVYILGDIANRVEPTIANAYIRRINGKKILIKGNHDIPYDFSLFQEITDYKEIKIDKRTYVLMHYPLIAWKRMKHGSLQLHGHLHSDSAYNEWNHTIGRLQYDVGVDANKYMPVSLEEIDRWADTAPWESYKGRDHHLYREGIKNDL